MFSFFLPSVNEFFLCIFLTFWKTCVESRGGWVDLGRGRVRVSASCLRGGTSTRRSLRAAPRVGTTIRHSAGMNNG